MSENIEKVAVNASDNSVLSSLAEHNHEQVLFCQDSATGLKSIIAVHDTTLGPAVGGTRMWAYPSEAAALTDALRLSRGMTYKNALAGLNIGGGKAVIIGDARKDKTEAMMRRYGRFVNSLGGKYITAEDVGVGTRDMEWVHLETEHVVGLPDYMGGGGDPSPVTAYGVYMAMKASQKRVSGSDSLQGKKIAVQGIGHVGEYLVAHLIKEGAEVTVTDIYEDRLKHVVKTYGVLAVEPEKIYDCPMDIYSPCALGATINPETLRRLSCHIICGAANNQLQNEVRDGEALMKSGILYAPDFMANAGGIINCYWEIVGYNRDASMAQTEQIYSTTEKIYSLSADEEIPTYLAANRLAEQRIKQMGEIKKKL